ncbi:MAG: trigger factor [Oscillospiraceae bacterium]|nr:trigger factor [Oscillospiraceae bacterium]
MILKSCEKKEKSTYGLVVEVTPDEFNAAIDQAYKKVKGQISVPGFRKGKAPRKIVESMYGATVFYEDAADIIVPVAMNFGAVESKLNIVGQPTIDDIDIAEDKTVTLTYTVGVYPEITLSEYKGISAVKPAVEVTDSDIDTEIEKVRYQNARIETVSRPVINGDTVNLDYCGTLDGVAFEGGTAENYELKIGSNTFIPGFEEKMQGMVTGEERDLELTFPTEYHSAELAGKDVIFHVKVNEIKSQVLPELDDEFVKDVSEDCDTVEDYRKQMAETIRLNKEAAAHATFENNVMDKLVAAVEGDIPESMIEAYIDNQVNNMRQNLSQYGMELEMYLNMMNMTMEAFRGNMRENAEKNAKVTVALEKVAELENIEISEEEITEGFKELSERWGMDVEDIRKEIADDMMIHDLKVRRAERIVMDSAVAEAPAEEAAAETTEE